MELEPNHVLGLGQAANTNNKNTMHHNQPRTVLTERRGSKAVRLPDNCSIFCMGESLPSIPTVAIFTGSPLKNRSSSIRTNLPFL